MQRTARALVACMLAAVVVLSGCGPSMSLGDAVRRIAQGGSEAQLVEAADVVARSLNASACADVAGIAEKQPGAEKYAQLVDIALQDTFSESDDPEQRAQAARCLGAMGASDAAFTLSIAAGSAEPAVRKAVAEALASIGGTEALAAMLEAMATEDDPEVLAAQAAAISAMPDAYGGVLGALSDVSIDASQQVQVARALRESAKAWIPQLLKELGGDNTGAAETLLSEIGEPAVGDLIKLLKSKKSDVRFAAASALARMENNVPGTVEKLTAALESKSLKTIATNYAFFIKLGRPGTEKVMRSALLKYGNKTMALDYLNCGNDALDSAARTWASRHGYTVYSTPGSYGGPSWGEGVGP